MVTLAPSLRRLFGEFNQLWPHRNRGIDGWLRWPSEGHSIGHNPGHNNMVHAIDVDRRGIDPDWVIRHIRNDPRALWYIIWNRGIWSNTWGFTRRPYTLSNPHTDHIHIEVRQTTYAEQWSGLWMASSTSGIGEAPPSGGIGEAPPSSGIGAAPDTRNPSGVMQGISDYAVDRGNHLLGHVQIIRQLRQR